MRQQKQQKPTNPYPLSNTGRNRQSDNGNGNRSNSSINDISASALNNTNCNVTASLNNISNVSDGLAGGDDHQRQQINLLPNSN